MLNKTLKAINKNLLLIFFFLFFGNYVSNFSRNESTLVNYYLNNKILFIIFLINAVFYIFLVLVIKKCLKMKSNSLTLIYFFSSYFIFDFFFLSILKQSSFHLSFTIVSIIWIFLISTKSNNKFNYLLFPFYAITYIVNDTFFTSFSKNTEYVELNTDVPIQWLGMSSKIYNYNYYELFTNNLIDGHGLLLSHFQSVIFKINFPAQDFEFVRLNANLLLIFSFLLFFDLNISKKDSMLLCLIFTFLILNSDWLTYLFIDSLMLEGIVSLFFASVLLNIKNLQVSNLNFKSSYFFMIFACLYLSKQFVSLLVVLILLFIFIKYKNLNVITGLSIISLDLFYKKLYTPSVNGFEYSQGLNYIDLFRDLFLLEDLEFSNVINILNQLFVDKPISLLLLVYFVLQINNYFRYDKHPTISNIIFFTILTNIISIFILYIAWWKNFGIQSSFRYILNTLHLIIIGLAMNLQPSTEEIEPTKF
jgi:hypothetical protein